MELIYAFILSVVGFVLIYQYGKSCAIKQRKAIDFGVIMAAFDFMVAGVDIAMWFWKR